METFNYNLQNLQNLSTLIMHYNTPDASRNQYDHYETLKLLLHIRHDILQCLLCEQLSIVANLGVGLKVYEAYGQPFDQRLAKTPDIYYEKDNKHYMIDPGISIDPVSYSTQKKDKYKESIDILSSRGFDICFIPICVRPELSDLDTVICYPISWPPSEGVLLQFQEIYDSVTEVINIYKPLCPDIAIDDNNEQFYTEHLKIEDLLSSQNETHIGNFFNNEKQGYMDYDNFKRIFYQLTEDPEIESMMQDKPIDKDKYFEYMTTALNGAKHDDTHAKPSFHIPYAPEITIENNVNIDNLRKDQRNSLNILSKFVNISDDSICTLIKHIFDQAMIALSYEGDKNMFDKDCYTGDYNKEFKLKEEKPKNVAMRDFLIGKGIKLAPSKPRILKGRLFNIKSLSSNQDFLYHSGVNFLKHNHSRKYKEPRDCPSDSYSVFNDFYDMVSDPILLPTVPDEILIKDPGQDSKTATVIKEEAIKLFIDYHNCISRTHAYRMAYHSNIVAKSLIHFNNLNTKESDFTLINSGQQNVCHIMQGGKRNKGNDTGNPFFTLVITDDKKWCNRVFGNYTVYTSGKLYYIVYHWRRLSSNRLSFISDSFYSCQSTGFDTFIRQNKQVLSREDLKRVYTFRTLVGLCTTQRLAEILMDIRYLCMSFISDYSDVAGLICEKFAPRYPNMFTYWIVSSLRDKIHQLIIDYNTPGNIIKKTAIFTQERRHQESTGGNINILSLWSNTRIRNLQDLLDELFVYCHTMKEPSSVFHEFKKCFKTIIDYQLNYDKMTKFEQVGEYNTAKDIKEWLLKIGKTLKPMGCWNTACYYASHTADLPFNSKKMLTEIKKGTQCEPLSELVSTKACIPEYNVTEVEFKKTKTRDNNISSLKKYLISRGVNPQDYNSVLRKLSNVAIGSVVMPEKESGRMKVIDCIQDFLVRYPISKTVLDIANWNITLNSSRVVADVCIKAQYGAKREFYVMNLGAKCMLRVLENTFKSIAKFMPEEMISVPGDTKLKHMSRISDLAIKWSPEHKYVLYFTNGDCSKWSASETMSSFMSFLDGFKDKLPEDLRQYCRTVIASWSNKHINIPHEMIKGTKFITEENNYMKSGTKVHSTQNFLQGMLNYTSSVKAILATRLAIKLWDENPSNEKIFVEQLGHSDDYILIMRCPNQETMLKFRIYHKLMQRMVGITDSSKKTNIQKHVMEFISLLSFNGQMAYPNIKKVKETGLNIACEGYQNDIMNVISRSGESVRLGVPLISAYIQQRLHCTNLYRAYTLAEGMRNETPASKNPFDWPIELFGLPDCLPILYVNSYCDPNNYRLYKYNPVMAKRLKSLVYLNSLSDEVDIYSPLDCSLAYKPVYRYKRAGGMVKKIRDKLGKSHDDVVKFYEDYPEYKIMKPNNPMLLQNWIQNLYYNNSFSKAYALVSRPNLLLRLSYFCSNACCYTKWSDKGVRLKEYFHTISQLIKDVILKKPKILEDDISNHLTSYNSNITLMFEMLEKCEIYKTSFEPQNPQAMHLPRPIKHTRLVNPLQNIIQFVTSEERFRLDGRQIKNPGALMQDINQIENIINKPLKSLLPTDMIKIHSLMRSQTTSSKYGIGYSAASDKSTLVYLVSWLSNGIDPRHKYMVLTEKSISVNHPVTGDTLFERDYGMHTHYANILIENLTQWYFYLVVKEGISLKEFKNIISSIKLKHNNLKDVLLNTPIDYQDTKDFIHKRMFAFFRFILFNIIEDLIQITTNSLSYKYVYLNKQKLEKLKEHHNFAHDGVLIRHQEINYVVFCDKERENFYIRTQNLQLTRVGYIYNIGLLLLRKITAEEYIRRMETGLINTIQTGKGDDRPGFARLGRNIVYKTDLTGMESLNLFIGDPGYFHLGETSRGILTDFILNEKAASIRCGGVQIFKLSLMACGQSNVIEDISGEVNGINLKTLNKDNLIYWYLRNHDVSSLIDVELTENVSQFRLPMRKLILNSGYSKETMSDLLTTSGIITESGIEDKNEKVEDMNEKNTTPQSHNQITTMPDELNEEELTNFGNLGGFSLLNDQNEFLFVSDAHCLQNPFNNGSDSNCLPNDNDIPLTSRQDQTLDLSLMCYEKDEEVIVEENDQDLYLTSQNPVNYCDEIDPSMYEEGLEDYNPDNDTGYMPDSAGYDEGFGDDFSVNAGYNDNMCLDMGNINMDFSLDFNQTFDGDSQQQMVESLGDIDAEQDENAIEEIDEAMIVSPNIKETFESKSISDETTQEMKKDSEIDLYSGLDMGNNFVFQWGDINIGEEPMRELNTFTLENTDLIEDIDAPSYSPEESISSDSTSEDSDLDLPFFLQDRGEKKQSEGYVDFMIKNLPSIHDYVIQQHIGINTNMLLNNTKMFYNLVKFCIQAEELQENGVEFSKKEKTAINLTGSLITQFVRNNLLPNGDCVGEVRISTTENCRMRLERQVHCNMIERAEIIKRTKKGRIENAGDGFDVIYWDEKLLRTMFKPPVNVSVFLRTNTFGKTIQDIERVLNDTYTTVEVLTSD